MKELANRVAWISGGASGIGLALAQRLAREQVQLVLVDIEQAALDRAAHELTAHGAHVLALRADVGNADQMTAATQRALDTFGVVHLIVNNAGVGGGGGPLWEASVADWAWTMNVNLWGVVHGIRLLLPPLLASGEAGHVVNTASIAGLTATPFMGPYTATKHAVVALSECLAKELELTKANVGVSVVCPGFVKTKIASQQHRPAGNAPSRIAAKLETVFEQLVDSGVPAEGVADQIVAAIRDARFYVLTHPELKPAIQHRMRQIVEETQPGIDPRFRQLFTEP